MKNKPISHTGIQVQDLYLTYTWGDIKQNVFTDLSFSIQPGAFVTITGDNASGKTSLLKLLTGLQKPDLGSIIINGIPVHETGVTGARTAGIGFLSQNPIYQILGRTVREELDYVASAAEDEKLKIANQFELTHLMSVSPQRLSGGERQRLALAVLALQNAPILLLDEPTSYLDAGQTEKLHQYLEHLHESGRTILHVTQYPGEALWGQRTLKLANGMCLELN